MISIKKVKRLLPQRVVYDDDGGIEMVGMPASPIETMQKDAETYLSDPKDAGYGDFQRRFEKIDKVILYEQNMKAIRIY